MRLLLLVLLVVCAAGVCVCAGERAEEGDGMRCVCVCLLLWQVGEEGAEKKGRKNSRADLLVTLRRLGKEPVSESGLTGLVCCVCLLVVHLRPKRKRTRSKRHVFCLALPSLSRLCLSFHHVFRSSCGCPAFHCCGSPLPFP